MNRERPAPRARLRSLVLLGVLALAPALHGLARDEPAKSAGKAEIDLAAIGRRLLAGEKEEAAGEIEEAVRVSREAGDPAGEATALILRGLLRDQRGEREGLAQDLSAAHRLFREIPDPLGAWMVSWMTAELEVRDGDLREAARRMEVALADLERLGDPAVPLRLDGMMPIAQAFGSPPFPPELLRLATFMKPIFLGLLGGITRDTLGAALTELGEFDAAEAHLKEALSTSNLLGGFFDSSVHKHLGDLRRYQWHLDEARDHYEKALAGNAVVAALPFGSLLSRDRLDIGALGRLAELENLAGRLDAALAHNDRALALARRDADRRLEARVLEARGELLLEGGRLAEAVAPLEEALRVALEAGDRLRQATVLGDLGFVAYLRGRPLDAASHLEKSLALLEGEDAPLLEAATAGILAEVYLYLEVPGLPESFIARIAERSRQAESRLGERLAGLLDALQRFRGDQRFAQELGESWQALWGDSAWRTIPLPPAVRRMMAAVWEFMAQVPPGGDPGEPGGDLGRQAIDPGGSASPSGAHSYGLLPVLSGLMAGTRAFQRGDYEEARGSWQAAFEEADRLGHQDFVGGLAALLGAASFKQGRLADAERWMKRAVGGLEGFAAAVRVEELLTSYLGSGRRLYPEILLEILAAEGKAAEAFAYTERSRARAFLLLLGNHRLRPAAGADPELVAQAEGRRAAIARWERERLREADPHRAEQLDRDLREARKEFQALLVRIKVTSPEYASMVGVEPLEPGEVQARLDPDATLLSYFTTDDAVHAWVLDRETLRHVPLEVSPEELKGALCFAPPGTPAEEGGREEQLEEMTPRGAEPLTGCPSRDRQAELFYQRLIAPLRESLRHPQLFVVPHGSLHYVPFAALRDPASGRYLVEDFTLTYLPSASTLTFLRQKESPVEGRGLVMGAPEVKHPDFPHLPATEREATAVAGLLGVQPLLGAEATEGRVRSLEGGIDLLHLAAHGFYDAVSPRFSRILLAGDEGHDGYLEVHEVDGELDLAGVNLVVLSACESARGERSRGDEVVGLTRAFLYAGAPGVISTLWSVADQPTAELMTGFYGRLLQGQTAAEALRGAQLAFLHHPRYADPYLWAAFTLTGDPQGRWGRQGAEAPAAGSAGGAGMRRGARRLP